MKQDDVRPGGLPVNEAPAGLRHSAGIPDAVSVETVKEIAWCFKGIPAAQFEERFPWFLEWMTSLEDRIGEFPWDKHNPAPEQLGFACGVLFALAVRQDAPNPNPET